MWRQVYRSYSSDWRRLCDLCRTTVVCDTIEKNRPTGCKGKLWNSAAICSTMGPATRLDLAELKAFASPN